jgi:hypothetical protein
MRSVDSPSTGEWLLGDTEARRQADRRMGRLGDSPAGYERGSILLAPADTLPTRTRRAVGAF